MIRRTLRLTLVLCIVSVACRQARQASERDMMLSEAESAGGFAAAMAPAAPPAEAPARARQVAAAPATPGTVPVPTQRKVIRHGNMSLEVDSVEEILGRIKTLVNDAGGYISNENVSEDYYARKSGSIACRIPAEKLDQAMEQIGGWGKVDNVSVNADDITDQYFDLEIRLENQKALAKRLVALLERRTNELKDLLEIERELARVRTQIDSMEGRKRLWDSQVALSTLVVEVHEPLPKIAGDEGGAWRTLLRSFGDAADNFVLTIAGIISASGSAIPLLAVLIFVVWIWRSWRKRKKKAAEAETGSDS
jgi:hypothetical protein